MEEGVGFEKRGLFVKDGDGHALSLFAVPFCYSADIDSVLIPNGLIHDRIRRMADEIQSAIGDRPLILVCLLKGAFRFFTALADCLSQIRLGCASPMQIEFIRAQSYLDQSSTGQVRSDGISTIDGPLRGAEVLLVDDIFDTGLTLTRIAQSLGALTEGRIWTAVLLSKRTPKRRRDVLREDFVAFSIPDRFVVGFGMDYNQKFRELSHICVMSKTAIDKYSSSKQ